MNKKKIHATIKGYCFKEHVQFFRLLIEKDVHTIMSVVSENKEIIISLGANSLRLFNNYWFYEKIFKCERKHEYLRTLLDVLPFKLDNEVVIYPLLRSILGMVKDSDTITLIVNYCKEKDIGVGFILFLLIHPVENKFFDIYKEDFYTLMSLVGEIGNREIEGILKEARKVISKGGFEVGSAYFNYTYLFVFMYAYLVYKIRNEVHDSSYRYFGFFTNKKVAKEIRIHIEKIRDFLEG
jgi:hypothetical protein